MFMVLSYVTLKLMVWKLLQKLLQAEGIYTKGCYKLVDELEGLLLSIQNKDTILS
jgi:hypothetical protein